MNNKSNETESLAPEMDNKITIFWDDAHIDAEAAFFPGELEDLYRRVKRKAREECAGDMGRVRDAFAKLGAGRDKTTWSRIFKQGRWNHDSAGNPLPSPIVAAKKLAEDFRAFLSSTRVELFRNKLPFSETQIWQIVNNYIAKKMQPERVNKFGVILGPTGLQKSASFRELAERNTNIKHMECAENMSANQLISMLAYKYGVSIYRNSTEKRFAVLENFGPEKCIVFDNTQDIYSMKVTDKFSEFLKFCRWLQDERHGTIIWSITPQEEDAIFPKESVFMEQFEGRAGGRDGFLRLPNQNPKADFVTIATDLGMKDAEKHAALLQQIGTMRGRIRTFYEILQEAKTAADADKSRLTAGHIEAALEDRQPQKGKEDK